MAKGRACRCPDSTTLCKTPVRASPVGLEEAKGHSVSTLWRRPRGKELLSDRVAVSGQQAARGGVLSH